MLLKTTLRLSLSFIYDYLMSLILTFFVSMAVTIIITLRKVVLTDTMAVIQSSFTAFMHCVLIYASAFKEAGRDQNRINYNHMKKFMLKGAAAMFIAIIPLLILYIGSVAGQDSLFPLFTAVCWQYIGFINLLSNIARPLAGLVFLIPATAAVLGYLAGYYDFNIIDRLVYVKSKKKL